MSTVLAGNSAFYVKNNAVMWCALQESPRLDGVAYPENNAVLVCVFSIFQTVFLTRWIGCEGESVEFLMVYPQEVS